MIETVQIQNINAEGNGIAQSQSGPVSVAFTLPEEIVTIDPQKSTGKYISLCTKSPERITPICQYFEHCGGCRLQHWADIPYQNWKRTQIITALQTENIHTPVEAPLTGPINARRRVTWHAISQQGKVQLGFYQRASHQILPIEHCPIIVPVLNEKIPILQKIAKLLTSQQKTAIHIHSTAFAHGIDLAINSDKNLSSEQRQKLCQLTKGEDILRVTFNGEIIIEYEKPILFFNHIAVDFPPAVFLQATAEAEKQMIHIVSQWLKSQKNIVDLFCGLGTFSLNLTSFANITGFDQEERALNALQKAADQQSNLKSVKTQARNLFKRPLLARELSPYDGLIVDPPRAGAEQQIREIAKTHIPKIASISCNPLTFARDLKILIEGGYKIEKIIPIDQFIWSNHIEVIALLSKEKPKRQWKL